jgi:hypothetical protein
MEPRSSQRSSEHALVESSNPDIAKADGLARIAVRLQFNRRSVVFLVEWLPNIVVLRSSGKCPIDK